MSASTIVAKGDRAVRRSGGMGPVAALLLALLLLLGGLLAACGQQETSGSGSQAAGLEVQSTTPSADGAVDQITWNLGYGEPTTIDPLKAGDYGPCFVASQLHDTLVRYSPDWELGPGIAESWEEPDPLTLVYHIRQDATFWDGSPVTVDDVIYSMKRHMDAENGSIWIDFYKYVESIEQTSPTDVTVKFTKPDELFNKEMGTVGGSIVKQAYVEKVGEAKYGSGTNVMGSGPYKIASWKPGTGITLEANPDYWDPALTPKVAKVKMTFIVETSTVTSGILSGEIDGAYGLPATSISALQTAPGTVYYGPSLDVTELIVANAKGPLGDPDVRTALSMSLDRQAIAEKIYNSAAVPNKTLTPPSAWDPAAIDVYKTAYDALPGLEPDIEGAKQLLAGKTGLDKPMVMALLAGDERELQLSSVIQQAAKDIGLTIELKPMQAMDLSNVFYVPSYRKGLDLVMAEGWLDIPDPLDYTVLTVMKGALFNWIDYDNPEMEKLLVQARQTFDPVERANLVVQAQAMYTADTVVVPIANPHQVLYLNNRISGAPVSFAYMWIPGLAMLGGTQ